MVHTERGLTYMCVCPNCGATCDLCLGGNAKEGVVIQKTEGGLKIPEYLRARIEEEYGAPGPQEKLPEQGTKGWHFDGSQKRR